MKQVKVGSVLIGGNAPISIQSMCNVPFSRFDELVKQSLDLERAGCEILRVSVPDKNSAWRFYDLKCKLGIPLVADIHFDYRLALEAIEAGADKIRINPGNIKANKLQIIAEACLKKNIPVRVGINAGSLEKEILEKYTSPCAQALAESAYKNVKLMEQVGVFNLVVSMKASSVKTTVDAYRIFVKEYNSSEYPLHIGVTEAGTLRSGLIKSAAGLGALLLDGIGNTMRVSLTANPLEEISAAKAILRAVGLDKTGLEVVSCPTCGRTTVNSIDLANKIEDKFSHITKHVKIAVMGCVVNGIGEAAEADFGVTGANGKYILFRGKEIIKDITEDKIFDLIEKEINKYL